MYLVEALALAPLFDRRGWSMSTKVCSHEGCLANFGYVSCNVHAILEALRKLLELIPLTHCMCHLKASQLFHFGKQLRRCSRDILKGF